MTTETLNRLDGTTTPVTSIYGDEWEISNHPYSTKIIMSPINKRIQVLEASCPAGQEAAWAEDMKKLATLNDYGKIWFKCRKEQAGSLVAHGFSEEGMIDGYFDGKADAHIVACYPDPARSERPWIADEDESLKIAGENLEKVPRDHQQPLPSGYESRIFEPGDEKELSELYSNVFPTYPYPIDDPAYLLETSTTNIVYRLVFNESGKLVAAASAETNPEYRNAEMTDFATLPSERGKGLGQYLLQELEKDARDKFDIVCNYTIARIAMPGMVRIFLKNRYEISGILTNNCSIAGQFETMVLMVKR